MSCNFAHASCTAVQSAFLKSSKFSRQQIRLPDLTQTVALAVVTRFEIRWLNVTFPSNNCQQVKAGKQVNFAGLAGAGR